MTVKSKSPLGDVQDLSHKAMEQAATSFHLSQRMAMEAVQFWARRMRAYADQMEALSRCQEPQQFWSAQQNFIERMRVDYTKESDAMRRLLDTTADKAAKAASAQNTPAAQQPN